MYITKREELFTLVEERKNNQEEIKERLNSWVDRVYGIHAFSDIVHRHFVSERQMVAGVLARQVPSIMVEDISCFSFCKLLGVQPVALSLLRDSFTDKNPDKVRRINISWITWSKSNHLIRQYERVVPLSNKELEGMVIQNIQTKFGTKLMDYHMSLRGKVFGGDYLLQDASAFHSECLSRARSLPEYAWRETGKGNEERVYRNDIRAEDFSLLRSPAKWYYPLYLSLFLDGRMILLETYENPEASVPYARLLFERTMEQLKEGVGLLPLVVEISPLTKDLMDYNRHLLEQSFSWEKVLQSIEGEENLLSMYEKITREIIAFGRKREGG